MSTAAASRPAAMRFILLAVLIDMVAVGLIIPVLPFLVTSFATTPSEQTHAMQMVAISYGVANFIGSPILGALSDRYGRRPVMLIGFAGLALSFFVTALATQYWMLIAVRLFSGAMQANVSVANAYVADITPPEQRTQRFGMLGAMFGAGFILGPALGGVLGGIDVRLPFWVAGTLALANLLYGVFVLPESLPAERRAPFRWARANPLGALQSLGQLRDVRSLLAVVACSGLAQFVLQGTWVLYTKFKFGWGPSQNGWALFLVGLTSVFAQGWLLKRLLERLRPSQLAVMGLVSSALCYVGWAFAWAPWVMVALIPLNLLGYVVGPSVQSMISGAADEQSQGRTAGAVSALNSLMAATAPLIGLTLLGWGASPGHPSWLLGLPFLLCTVLQLGSTAMAWRHLTGERGRRATQRDAPSNFDPPPVA